MTLFNPLRLGPASPRGLLSAAAPTGGFVRELPRSPRCDHRWR